MMEDDVLSGSFQHTASLSRSHKHHHVHHPHHICRRRRSSSGDEAGEEEELDPRIQGELEKLNRATEEINRLELELDDARASFRQVLSDSSQRLNGLAKKLGTCVDKARPYYDARMKLKEAHLESQKAALRFERACSMHEAAKEMVQLAEEGYKRREEDLDPTWQEMLNHATMKVNDAESERMESEDHHQAMTLAFKKRDDEVHKLQRDLKRAITKSKPYFEMKAKFNQVMEDHKRNVSHLEEDVASTKSLYSEALRNLEAISDDIHRQRLERRQKLQLGIRGAGVGAESPSPPPSSWEKGVNIEGSAYPVYDSDGEEDSEGSPCKFRKRRKEQGIVGHDLPICSQYNPDLDTGSLKPDPLNLVIFKASNPPRGSSHAQSFGHQESDGLQPPSVIHPHASIARSSSYRRAVSSLSGAAITMDDKKRHLSGCEEDVDVKNTSHLTSSSMPAKSAHRTESEADALQSSLCRAQEWVNRSPVPQQRRFVKSKSLIDAVSSSSVISHAGSKFSPPPPSPSSFESSDQTAQTRSQHNSTLGLPDKSEDPSLARNVYTSSSALSMQLSSSQVAPNQHHSHVHGQVYFQYPVTETVHPGEDVTAIQIQPHLHSPHQSTAQSSPRSVAAGVVRQSVSPSSSPSGKSPKLQGLILRVDASEMLSFPSTSSVARMANSSAPGSSQRHPSSRELQALVMSRNIPALGVMTSAATSSTAITFTHPSTSSYLNPPTQSSSLQPSPSSISPASRTSTPLSSSSSMANFPFKLPSSSKSASTHAPAFRLPSPTHSRSSAGLTATLPLPQNQVMASPTPPSPSGDRVSVLSGRSDSTRGGHLLLPSDSSDTESIASTGPMLDDDQVELLTLDFNEHSISSGQGQAEDGDFPGDDDSSVHLHQRGAWSRMSLPSRLSYLGSFLDRTRQAVHTDISTGPCDSYNRQCEGMDDVDSLSPQQGEDAGESDKSSPTGSGRRDHQDNGDAAMADKSKAEMGDYSIVVDSHATLKGGESNNDDACDTSVDVCITLDAEEYGDEDRAEECEKRIKDLENCAPQTSGARKGEDGEAGKDGGEVQVTDGEKDVRAGQKIESDI